jgi:hypothetical protein
MFKGPMPRSHKFPSSSSGMNSRPSCGIKQNVPPIKNAIAAQVVFGNLRHSCRLLK